MRVTVERMSKNVPLGEEPEVAVRMPDGNVRETTIGRLALIVSSEGTAGGPGVEMGGTRGAGVQQADLAALTEFWGRESAM